MTPDEREQFERIVAKADRPQVGFIPSSRLIGVIERSTATRSFMASARGDVLWLARLVKRMDAELEQLRVPF